MGEHVKPTKILERFGLTATIIYVLALVVGIPLLAKFGYIKLDTITLNELGDFLAGAFGPLAIFWLVLGFFQQGQELRNSVATLELQARELANSVEQQRELVNVSRLQLDNERLNIKEAEQQRKARIQPSFILDFGATSWVGNSVSYTLYLANVGHQASQIKLDISMAAQSILSWNERYVERGWKGGRDAFSGNEVLAISEALDFGLTYADDDGDLWKVSGILMPPNSGEVFGSFHVHISEKCMI